MAEFEAGAGNICPLGQGTDLTASWHPVLWPMSTQELHPCSAARQSLSNFSSAASWSKDARPQPWKASVTQQRQCDYVEQHSLLLLHVH